MGMVEDLIDGFRIKKTEISPKADLSAAAGTQQPSEKPKPKDLTEHLLKVGNAKAVGGQPRPGSLLG